MTLARLAIASFLTAAATQAQSILPATQPTTIPATAPTAPATAIGPINATPVSRATRPTVTFNNGLLDVRASNASLHQILRLISRQTGMRITGGVEDQRVFGNYGPAEPGSVLATLLDGTGVNIIFREDQDHKPMELVMTPRSGSVTPPAVPQQSADDDAPADTAASQQASPAAPPPATRFEAATPTPQPTPTTQPNANLPLVAQPAPPTASGPPSIPQPLNNVLGNPANTTPTASQFPTTNSVPLDSLPTPSTTTQSAQGIVDSGNPAPAGSTSSGTPPATTPEQIYQQLLKLQQQQQKPATTTPAPN